MAMVSTSARCMVVCMLLLMVVPPALSGKSPAGRLWYEYYSTSCPKAEELIRNVTREIISEDNTMAAAFVKLFFVDCLIGGCEASILLEPTKNNSYTEKEFMAQSLRATGAVKHIKAAVETLCPGVVSCADIIAVAARNSVAISGGFSFAMPTGRRDGLSPQQGVNSQLPFYQHHVQQLIANFADKGLDVDDLVVLSGAHSFGMTNCSLVYQRLYPSVDSTMNATYAADLKKVCGSSAREYHWYTKVNLNLVTDHPNKLSNQYYRNVKSGQVLFTSDQTLMDRNDTADKVAYYAANPMPWMARFAKAFVKMGSINVITGTAGEIRKFCSATNSASGR